MNTNQSLTTSWTAERLLAGIAEMQYIQDQLNDFIPTSECPFPRIQLDNNNDIVFSGGSWKSPKIKVPTLIETPYGHYLGNRTPS